MGIAGLTALLVVVLVWSAAPRVFRRPAPFEVVGYVHDPASGLASARAHADKLTSLSPLWFSIGSNGALVDPRPDPALRELARSQRIPLVVLINNKKGGGDNGQFLRSDSTRRRAVQEITALVEREGYEGVNIDVQEVKPELREELTAFIRDLSRALHGKKKIVAVSVIPPVGVSPDVTQVYDYRALGQAADYLVFFGYDRHNPSTGPGAIGPTDWVEANIKKLSSLVPARKLVLGVGVYGYDWPSPARSPMDVQPLSMAEARSLAQVHHARLNVQPGGQVQFFYTTGGRSHEVWFQDATNLKEKMDLAKRYSLRGIALWRLGFEEPDHWKVIPPARRR